MTTASRIANYKTGFAYKATRARKLAVNHKMFRTGTLYAFADGSGLVIETSGDIFEVW